MDALSGFVQKVPQPVLLALSGVGALYAGAQLWNVVKFVFSVFILSGTDLRKYGKPGSWVVITGASDGLGKEFAAQLAAKGFNLVLVSRTQSKLDTIANELEERYANKNLQVKTLAMDFSQNNDSDYDKLAALVKGLDVAILLNNVGQSHSIPTPFLDTTKEELESIVNINCMGTLKVTKVIVPILKERKQRSLILTMGSTAGWSPTPLLATYSGSKAFLQSWNTALASELSEHKIDVYLVLSHLVTTAMSKIRRPSLMVPTARNFVKAALGKIGLGGFQVQPNTYTPWWMHSLMIWAVETVPGATNPLTVGINKSMHVDIRRRALRKAARDAKKQ